MASAGLNINLAKRLEGVWKGTGRGAYPPRVPEFVYHETLTISPTAKPFVWAFHSMTKHAETGKPMHVETGYIRAPPSGTIELIATHPFGLTEISQGTPKLLGKIELMATESGLQRVDSATSPYTTGLRRVYEISEDGQSLLFTMDMATNNHPELSNHLVSRLTREQ
jgi:hypothetical protein